MSIMQTGSISGLIRPVQKKLDYDSILLFGLALSKAKSLYFKRFTITMI